MSELISHNLTTNSNNSFSNLGGGLLNWCLSPLDPAGLLQSLVHANGLYAPLLLHQLRLSDQPLLVLFNFCALVSHCILVFDAEDLSSEIRNVRVFWANTEIFAAYTILSFQGHKSPGRGSHLSHIHATIVGQILKGVRVELVLLAILGLGYAGMDFLVPINDRIELEVWVFWWLLLIFEYLKLLHGVVAEEALWLVDH